MFIVLLFFSTATRVIGRRTVATNERSNEVLSRPKYDDKSSLQKNFADSKPPQNAHRSLKERPPSDRHQRHTSEPNRALSRGGQSYNNNSSNNNKLRPYSAVTTDILEPKKMTKRQLSADSIRRRHGDSGKTSPSFRRLEKMSTAICAYTGSNDLLKYYRQNRVPDSGMFWVCFKYIPCII